MREVVISKEEANQRADKYILKYFNQASKGFIYKMIRKKRIKLNNKKISGNEILKPGDTLQIYFSTETINKFSQVEFEQVNITFSIIYEDENILICNKPVGLLSQPDGSADTSLVDEVITYLIQTNQFQPETTKGFRPGICNRLDRNTSGIVLVGKHVQALQVLNKMIHDHKIDKYYKSIVGGKVNQKKEISGYIIKNQEENKVFVLNETAPNSSQIKTIYDPISSNDDYSLLEIKLITGKTHQIRVHLASEHHPLVGDYKYGIRKMNDIFKKKYGLQHQLLHANRIRFHPTDGLFDYLSDKEFLAPIPSMMKRISKDLFNRVMK